VHSRNGEQSADVLNFKGERQTMRFRSRSEAGRELAGELDAYAGRDDVLVLGLPRGGVPVAFEVAVALRAPLDVLLVRKLGVPGHEELAMGAIASGGVLLLDQNVSQRLRVPRQAIADVIDREKRELTRREELYRKDRPEPEIPQKSIILVDDGLATGSSMQAAIMVIRERDPGRIVVAAPVGAREAVESLRKLVDQCVCLSTPPQFKAVGQWYNDFPQTTDEEVMRLLDKRRRIPHRRRFHDDTR
jgi:putative phosphoribosyl transferase